jgi:hypothetical protein
LFEKKFSTHEILSFRGLSDIGDQRTKNKSQQERRSKCTNLVCADEKRLNLCMSFRDKRKIGIVFTLASSIANRKQSTVNSPHSSDD